MISFLSIIIIHKISGPLLLNDEYLLVADYSQQNVYQLQLNSDEVRALPMGQCRPVSLAFDPSIKCLYIICDEEYLLVADHNQQNIYQLQLNSGEVRALPVSPCRPVSLAFDPSIKGLYITCDDEGDLYRIHKKTLDGKIDEIVYSAPQSTFVFSDCTCRSIGCKWFIA